MKREVLSELQSISRLVDVARLGLDREGEWPALNGIVDDAAAELDVPISLATVLLDQAQVFLAATPLPGWAAQSGGVPAEWAICTGMLADREPLVVPDLAAHPTLSDNPLVRVDRARSYAGVPLISRRGHMVGSICVLDMRPRDFSVKTTGALGRYAALAMDLIERDAEDEDADLAIGAPAIGTIEEEALAWRATHDRLTGLPNRALLLDRLRLALARTERTHRSVTLLSVGVGELDKIERRYGTVARDELIRATGARLTADVRPADTVARLGDDRFAVLCDDQYAEQHVTGIRKRLGVHLTAPVMIGAVVLQPSFTIGYAHSENEATAEDLLSAADRSRRATAPARQTPASITS